MMGQYRKAIESASRRLGEIAKTQGIVIVTAESCTGGGIAHAMTAVPGSSAWFDSGFVTYSNAAKRRMLNVNEETLDTYGAVSLPVVAEMTAGVLSQSQADWAVAVSGIAGPGGAVPGKPVGTVCFSWQTRGEAAEVSVQHFVGDRQAVRDQTILHALNGLLERLLKR